jgi:hypothetical protein
VINRFLTTRAGKLLSVLLAAVLGALGLFKLGERNGAAKASLNALEDDLEAAKNAKDNRHEIETADDQRLVDILAGRGKL